MTRATLVYAEKQNATLVLVRRLDSGRDDPYTNTLISECPAQLLILKATTKPEANTSSILTLASPGPNTCATLKFATSVAKSLELNNITALNLETISGHEASLVSTRQVENLAKQAKVDPKFLNIKTAPEGPLKKTLLETSEHQPYQLLLLGSTEKGVFRRLFFGMRDEEALRLSKNQTIGVYRRSLPMSAITKKWFDRVLIKYVPQMDREARINIFANLQTASYWNFDFIALISLASAIASLGLIQNSPAIVIGAMLVAPLMTPMIGAGLGLVQGNGRLVSTAAKTIGFGFLLSLGIGAFLATQLELNHRQVK